MHKNLKQVELYEFELALLKNKGVPEQKKMSSIKPSTAMMMTA
jgi:hypothetical protein